MARQPRRPIANGIYHVLNRGNCRMDIFAKPGDFQSFLKLLVKTKGPGFVIHHYTTPSDAAAFRG